MKNAIAKRKLKKFFPYTTFLFAHGKITGWITPDNKKQPSQAEVKEAVEKINNPVQKARTAKERKKNPLPARPMKRKGRLNPALGKKKDSRQKKMPARKNPMGGDYFGIYGRIYDRLNKLLDGNFSPDQAYHLKSGGKMDLVVETQPNDGSLQQPGIILLLAHYYTQNGDLMSDPLMKIGVYPTLKMAEALSYQHDPFTYQVVYPAPGKVNISLKKQLNSFLSGWLKTLIEDYRPGRKNPLRHLSHQERETLPLPELTPGGEFIVFHRDVYNGNLKEGPWFFMLRHVMECSSPGYPTKEDAIEAAKELETGMTDEQRKYYWSKKDREKEIESRLENPRRKGYEEKFILLYGAAGRKAAINFVEKSRADQAQAYWEQSKGEFHRAERYGEGEPARIMYDIGGRAATAYQTIAEKFHKLRSRRHENPVQSRAQHRKIRAMAGRGEIPKEVAHEMTQGSKERWAKLPERVERSNPSRNRRHPKGSMWARKVILDSIVPDDHTPERQVFAWPYYAWSGTADGHIVEMVPVEERTSGGITKYSHIRVYVDGRYVAKLDADGHASRIADYLRGGHYDEIGESLQAHQQAEKGMTSIGTDPEMSELLRDILAR
jgi:hypothetical protein